MKGTPIQSYGRQSYDDNRGTQGQRESSKGKAAISSPLVAPGSTKPNTNHGGAQPQDKNGKKPAVPLPPQSSKATVMNEAGQNMLRNESGSNIGGSSQYGAGKSHSSPMQQPSSLSPSKMGGHFQHNAFMMMTPYQMMPGMPVAGYPMGMPMGMPGYPMMADPNAMRYPPGMMMYPPMQPMMMQPDQSSYMNGQNSRTANAYFSSSVGRKEESEKKYGMTEQGNFKVDLLTNEGAGRIHSH
jgi:hypothetical protein